VATIYWRPGGRKHQPGATAYLNWRERDQQFRRSLGKLTPGAAEKIRSAKAAELEHGVRILPRGPLAKDFFEWYAEWYASEHPTTAKRLVSELKPFLEAFGAKSIDAISPRDIENWKVARLKTHAPETVGKELRRVQAALRRGIAWKDIDANPAQHIKAPRGVRDAAVDFYTEDQIAALYAANPARAALWSLAVNTGLRRGELAKATKADIATYGGGKKKTQRLRIESTPDATGAGRTKSGKWREIPLNKDALAAIKALPDQLAGGVHADTLSDWFALDATKAKIGGSLHRLRHTFCAHLAIAGVSLRRIQVLAGHSDYKVTERYAHLSPAGGSDAVDLLSFSKKPRKSTPKAHGKT
jgi:integrase